jgi:signal transduction histidine kinase
MASQQLNRLKELFEVSNTLVSCKSIESVAEKAIRIARDKVKSQTASVFLFSKDGLLKRFRMCGIDSSGQHFSGKWFPAEKYVPGKSFTGRVVVSGSGSTYGVPQWSNTLGLDKLDRRSKKEYLKKLGALHCAVAAPLNGRHRTFGVLEVINKLDDRNRAVPTAFSAEDMYWLSIIAMNLGTAISRLRSSNESQLLAEMSKMLVEPFSSNSDLESFYQKIVDQLVSKDTCYKVCFLRVATKPDTLEVVSKAGDDISWSDERGEPIRILSELPRGEGFAGRVFASGVPIIIRDLREKASEFQNVTWIQSNHLRSYACVPLKVKDKVVGTLSVYTGFVHQFDESDVDLLNNIAFLVAAFVESRRLMNELEETREQLHDEWQKIVDSARLVGFDRIVDDVLHVYKNELIKTVKALKEYELNSPGRKDEIVRTQVALITHRIGQIEKEFSNPERTRVNVNNIVRDVVRYFTLDLKRQNFTVQADYDSDVPDILAKEEELREVVRNLVDNAVKAIRKANRKEGLITVQTELITEKRIEYIQISIEDNGLGIRNEDRDLVYERGYSTYDGGTGMGLFIVAKTVSTYGGSVDFVSTVGKGSKFTVKIPVRRHKP